MDNRVMAERFKVMLKDDSLEPPENSEYPQHDHSAVQPDLLIASNSQAHLFTQSQIPGNIGNDTNQLLLEAFRREYTQPEERKRSMSYGGGPDQTEIWRAQSNHLLIGDNGKTTWNGSQHVKPTMKYLNPHLSQSEREQSVSQACLLGLVTLKRVRAPRGPAHPLLLPGMGDGRQRNEYGKSLTGGQDLGVGVIGGADVARQRRSTTVVVTSTGCDISMMRGRPAQQTSEGSDAKAVSFRHEVSLEPDLPPLAVDHPARVWNATIHSLGSDILPIVKWDYDRLVADQADAGWLVSNFSK